MERSFEKNGCPTLVNFKENQQKLVHLKKGVNGLMEVLPNYGTEDKKQKTKEQSI